MKHGQWSLPKCVRILCSAKWPFNTRGSAQIWPRVLYGAPQGQRNRVQPFSSWSPNTSDAHFRIEAHRLKFVKWLASKSGKRVIIQRRTQNAPEKWQSCRTKKAGPPCTCIHEIWCCLYILVMHFSFCLFDYLCLALPSIYKYVSLDKREIIETKIYYYVTALSLLCIEQYNITALQFLLYIYYSWILPNIV